MRGVLLFFLGIAIGFLMCKSFSCDSSSDDNVLSEQDSMQIEKIIDDHHEKTRQYFDVIMPNKKAYKLYTYMHKDSVEALLGKPKSNSVSNHNGTVRETWEYGTIGNQVTLHFTDGELQDVYDNKLLQ